LAALVIKLAYRLMRVYWFLVRPITMGTRIFLINDDQVVLVKHSYQDAWFLPGGGIKRNESLEQAIRREAAEECGATIEQMRFLGIYTNFVNYKNDHIALFASDDFTLTEKRDHEIEHVAFFPMNQLPEKISPGSRRKIEAYINERLESTGIW
jgi:8-oxo-dGTP pyrophosphatase MutT (NUDIX family)